MPRILSLAAMGMIAMACWAPASARAQRPEFADVELTKVRSQMKSGGAVLIDAREPAAFERSHLKGATSLPMSQLRDWDRFGIGRVDKQNLAKTLPKGSAIYVQGPGPRAARAAGLLQGMGYQAQPLRANWGQFLDAGFTAIP
ncbi:MAG: rhodanese-like domain-containing protein [Isosphaeraceae bacterium]